MILQELKGQYDRVLRVVSGDVLMLGRQVGHVDGRDAAEFFKARGAKTYTQLDPDGGDLLDSLDADLENLAAKFDTLVNFGTIEHVWDAHRAWSNALRMVKPGGHFVSASPVSGWENHGIHVTDGRYVSAFFEQNKCEKLHEEYSRQDGTPAPRPVRGAGTVTMWAVYRKKSHIGRLDDYVRPQQVFKNGAPV